MRKKQQEKGEIECPQKKRYLFGSNAGTVIMISLEEDGKGKCPMSGICKTLCDYNK